MCFQQNIFFSVQSHEGNYKSHSGSVDQLCWHPTKRDVFATASADKTMRIWDARGTQRSREWGLAFLLSGGVLISEGVVLCTGLNGVELGPKDV